MNILFYGKWGRPGHFYYAPGQRGVWDLAPWDHIDAKFLPDRDGWQVHARNGEIEGEAVFVISKGWTVIQFWDRSGDVRFGSNSSFLMEGEHTFEEVLEQARAKFPTLFERFTFEIAQVNP